MRNNRISLSRKLQILQFAEILDNFGIPYEMQNLAEPSSAVEKKY